MYPDLSRCIQTGAFIQEEERKYIQKNTQIKVWNAWNREFVKLSSNWGARKKYQKYCDKIFAKYWNYLSNQLVIQWKVALLKNALNASKLNIWRRLKLFVRWWFGNIQWNVASLKKALIASKLDIWRRLKLFVKSSDIDSRHTYWSGEMVSTIIIIDNFPFQHHKCPLIMIIVAEKLNSKRIIWIIIIDTLSWVLSASVMSSQRDLLCWMIWIWSK